MQALDEELKNAPKAQVIFEILPIKYDKWCDIREAKKGDKSALKRLENEQNNVSLFGHAHKNLTPAQALKALSKKADETRCGVGMSQRADMHNEGIQFYDLVDDESLKMVDITRMHDRDPDAIKYIDLNMYESYELTDEELAAKKEMAQKN